VDWLFTLFWFPLTLIGFILTVIFWVTIIYLGYQVITESWDDFQYWKRSRKEPELGIDDYVNMGVVEKSGRSNNRRRK
jgi:hypothetical protein